MIKKIDLLLKQFSPALHFKAKKWFNDLKKKFHPKITKKEFIDLLQQQLKIQPGDTVFIHSSMRKLYLDFPKSEILNILQEIVGIDGTLIFPCWHFNTRAEEYIQEHDIVFSIKESPSAMGKISDQLRYHPTAFRSLHPTNSVIAIGKNAQFLVEGHEQDVYPCGLQSPFYKMMSLNAKVIGIGVSVENLTFVHVIEDVIKEAFPVQTRSTKIYDCPCINSKGEKIILSTKVATPAVTKRNVTAFFDRYISQAICHRIRYKKMDFFSSSTPELFESIENCAKKGQTIYLS